MAPSSYGLGEWGELMPGQQRAAQPMAARFCIAPAPTLGPGAQRYSVACRYATTSMAWTPAELVDLTPRQMVSVTLQHHEGQCGRCNLSRLWLERGSLALKRWRVDPSWNEQRVNPLAERRS